MPIIYSDEKIMFQGHCTVDEAELFLTTLLEQPKPLDMEDVTHLHTSLLQVMMAGAERVQIMTLPQHDPLRKWIIQCGFSVSDPENHSDVDTSDSSHSPHSDGTKEVEVTEERDESDEEKNFASVSHSKKKHKSRMR